MNELLQQMKDAYKKSGVDKSQYKDLSYADKLLSIKPSVSMI